MILQAFFGEDQTGLGYQFYDKDGTLLGSRVTTGIDSLPEAGGYAVEVVVPDDAVGIYWSSDTQEASAPVAAETVVDSVNDPLQVATPSGSSGLLSAGFGTLAQLKARVLPSVMESYDNDGEWDTDLAQIGIAVAEAFNRYCNRVFQRGVSVAYDDEGGVRSFVLDRYPVESITALQLTTGGGTTDEMESIYLVKPDSGIVELQSFLGTYRDRITCTYSGGYWLGATASVARNVVEAIPAGETQVAVTPPDGFLAGHAVQVSVERLTGDGQLGVANFDTTGDDVVVTFTGAPVAAETFRASVRFEIAPSEEQPSGATPLPGDLFEAWVMQSQAAVEHLNTLRGAGVQTSGERVGSLGELELLPAVRQILNPYKRWR
jgi:hypothetical protein